jgi:hypothetical protein
MIDYKKEKIIGESKSIRDHETKGIMLDESKAQKLADMISERMKWPKFTVTISNSQRVTRRRATVWVNDRRIILYKKTGGNNVCTVLHEMAHNAGWNHNKIFQFTHLNLISLWDKEFKNLL